MSLTIALRTALSGIQTSQTSIAVTSNNVSNANTEGYSRKTVGLQSRRVGSVGAGVEIGDVSRSVDEFLIAQVRNQVSLVGQQDRLDKLLFQLQGFMGAPNSDESISANLNRMNASLETLALTPESNPARFDAVNEARKFAVKLNQMSQLVQSLRADSDSDIARSVGVVTEQLTLINTLNAEITRGEILNEPTGDARDQRDIALKKLAEEMDIRTIEAASGAVTIFTGSGRTLLNDGSFFNLTHTPATQFSATVKYVNPGDANYPGPVNGIFLGTPDLVAGTNDLTNEILSGRLKGSIDLRDSVLPNLQAELDRLSDVFSNQMNLFHNQGTAFPPPSSLTGTQAVAATDAFTATGNIRIAVLNQSTGAVVEFADINLGGLGATATVNDVVTAINAGLTGTPASINAAGRLVFTAQAAGQGISINERDSAVTVVTGQTRGFSHYFGVNDLFEVNANTSQYTNFATAPQSSSTTALGLTGTLNFRFDNTAGVNVAYAATDTLEAIATSINGTAALTAQNISAVVETESGGRRLVISDSDGNNFVLSDSSTLLTTLQTSSNTSNLSSILRVRSDIQANSDLLSRGTLDLTAAVGDTGISIGDGSTANNLAGVFTTDQSFALSGGIANTTTSITKYAAQIIELQATLAADARDDLDFGTSFKETLEFRQGSDSGVNIDEELANLVILQQAFTASARAFTTASEMLETLVNSLR